jgi:hypothetical protein
MLTKKKQIDDAANDEYSKMKFPRWVWITFLVMSFIKIWLTNGQTLSAIGYFIQDDQLFVKLAGRLLQGSWLGPYDTLTLVKGPFYSMWIAFSFIVNIPLLSSQQILNAIACIVLVVALRPLYKRPVYAVILFGILVFDPMSYAFLWTRVLRGGIYTSLTLLVIACSLGFLLDRTTKRSMLLWSTGLGVSLSCFWLTREEGFWILPFLSIIGLFCIYHAAKRHKLITEIAYMSLTFIIWMASVTLVCTLNYSKYGVFAKTEMDASSFKDAYGALSRVKNETWVQYLVLSRKTRDKIYEVSPAFAELRPFLDGDAGKKWWTQDPLYPHNEVPGLWFLWAFREAVELAGYGKDGRYPEEYYTRLANEVNSACESGKLDCEAPRSTIAPVWHKEYIPLLLQCTLEKIQVVTTYKDVNASPSSVEGVPNDKNVALFRDITREQLTNDVVPPGQARVNEIKVNILNKIADAYRYFYIILLCSLGMFVYHVIVFIKGKKDFEPLFILTSLILVFFARIILLSFFSISSGFVWGFNYLNSIFPVMLIFMCINVFLFIDHFLRKKDLSHQPKGSQ